MKHFWNPSETEKPETVEQMAARVEELYRRQGEGLNWKEQLQLTYLLERLGRGIEQRER